MPMTGYLYWRFRWEISLLIWFHSWIKGYKELISWLASFDLAATFSQSIISPFYFYFFKVMSNEFLSFFFFFPSTGTLEENCIGTMGSPISDYLPADWRLVYFWICYLWKHAKSYFHWKILKLSYSKNFVIKFNFLSYDLSW